MYKCKEIIELISHNMEESLPWRTRMEMKLHLLVCKTCSRYAKQLQFMNKALSSLGEHGLAHTENCQLSNDAKQRIAKKIQQAKKTEN
ncbi:MAG: zf-HC2 domain-containing protein [Methyloprofundus sp.]|nr:zf-HC2 domain-containing protein [Methyloprofundus sp.]MBW6453868.1 zf-HC2 domain-containing protein [Methyloprofundus sp.]